MGFGNDLRIMRLRRGYKLRPFAKMVGISPTYLSRLERGLTLPPSIDVLTRIAKLLNINPDITILRAGRMPAWIKELFLSEDAIYCVNALEDVRNGKYKRRIFTNIK